MELNKVYNEDCLEGMKMIPDKSVDLIVIDPPYNIGKDKRWDKFKKDEYLNFMGAVFKECERVLKENGSFYWFHNDMIQIKDLMQMLEKGTSFVFKQFIVWNKRFNEAKNKGFLDGFVVVDGLRNYQQMAEYCLFYTFQDETGSNKAAQGAVRDYLRKELKKYGIANDINKLFWKNGWAKHGSNIASHFFGKNNQNCLPTEENYKRLQATGYFQKEYEDLKKEYEEVRYAFNNQKIHHSVWNYEIAPKKGHITPKPVEMIENIIKHSSNEGGVVLDCFMGSFTTAIACINTKRNYIGFELDETYYQIGCKRVEEHLQKIKETQISLF